MKVTLNIGQKRYRINILRLAAILLGCIVPLFLFLKEPNIGNISSANYPNTFEFINHHENGLATFFDPYQIGFEVNLTNQALIGENQWSRLPFKNNDDLPPKAPPMKVTPPESLPAFDAELANKKLIALTFDDGPHPTHTPKLLDILKEHRVPATFFALGSQVKLHPEIVARTFSDGHQIGNHTYNHRILSQLTEEELQKEIRNSATEIENITGKKPNSMRPPYGIYNAQVLNHAHAAVILWSIDPEDWKQSSVAVYNHVIQQTKDGDIILLHDIYETTIKAVEPIILQLKKEGFTFVTVEQLIKSRDQLNEGQVYYNAPRLEKIQS